MNNQPSEVKEGGALEAAVERLTEDAQRAGYSRSWAPFSADLRTILDALAARPASMERGEGEKGAMSLFNREHRLTDEDIISTVQRIRDNVEEIPDWGNSLQLLTIHCHVGVLLEDLPPALAAPSPAPSAVEMAGAEEVAKLVMDMLTDDTGAFDTYSEQELNAVEKRIARLLALATASREKEN